MTIVRSIVRLTAVIVIVCVVGLLGLGAYSISRPITGAAVNTAPASIIKTDSVAMQATTIKEVEARKVLNHTVVEPKTVFKSDSFAYRISYPFAWEKLTLMANVVIFRSTDGDTRVKVETVGSIPADSLTQFVSNSLISSDIILSRQSLTIHGQLAERVLTYSNSLGEQITNFYIVNDVSTYIITGTGEQLAIEMIARSFNAPQVVAQQ